MREVKVERLKLLTTVTENRKKHIAEYKEAMDGYKEAALKAIDDGIEQLKQQVKDLKAGRVLKLIHVMFNLPTPENHEKDYDQVVKMLEFSVDDTLMIKSDEFAMYVMDDWSWKASTNTVNAMYAKK